MKRVQQIRRLHISWHIAWLCTGLIIGVALTARINTSVFVHPLWLLVGTLLAIISFAKRTARLVTFSVCAGLILGLWRGSIEQQALAQYKPLLNTSVILRGRVSEDTSTGKAGDTQLMLRDISLNGQLLHGRVWASTISKATVQRSDTVVLQGVLKEGFGNIPASMARAKLMTVNKTSNRDLALRARDWFAGGIRRAIPEPQASLGSGFIVGQHSSLPGNLDGELRAVGLTHAVVASGSNLTILVGFSRRLLSRVSKYTATLFGCFIAAGFIMITGLSPSMTRAGLVTGLSLAAWYYGRRIHPLVLLPFAAALTIIASPAYAWGDIGWQLSFGAFAGVLILAPLIQHYFWGKDYEPNVITEILIGTAAAQIVTMPIILFAFGTYSSYALAANMLVLPLIPFAMLLTFAAGIAGLIVPAYSTVIGWPATMLMKYMTNVIHWIANWPGAQGSLGYSSAALTASYAIMLVLCWYLWQKTDHNFRTGRDIILLEQRH